MNVSGLVLTCFRNHKETAVTWAPRLNVITGPNGAGKTNLIDAIHYLCMSRSFVATSDQHVVTSGEKSFTVEARFSGAIRSKPFDVRCTYSRGEGKRIYVNDSPLDKLSDLIGRVPVVVLSPDDKKLTREGPAERRSFLDGFIAQLSSAYLRDLIDYRRVLKQRNALLADYRMSRDVMQAMIEPWDLQLATLGSRIVHTRAQTLLRFTTYLEKGYETIAGIGHKPTFVYKTFINTVYSDMQINDYSHSGGADPDYSAPFSDSTIAGGPDPGTADSRAGNTEGVTAGEDAVSGGKQAVWTPEEIQQSYTELLQSGFDKDRERQQTTIGPHRDDIVFYLNDLELRKFGSQGQHRLFALALKLAQRDYYTDELGDMPIFLLDDVFGDLDPSKTQVLVNMLLEQSGQVFITAANRNLFTSMFTPQKGMDALYRVADGQVTPLSE